MDPDCLMAYWGIGLALAAPNNEFTQQRQVAVMRMIELIDATREVLGKQGPIATKMEQQYALALAELFRLRGRVGEAFGKLSETYPNNLLAKCLAIYLQRDGFDRFGPRAKQAQAMDQMAELVETHPDNLAVLGFWVMLHGEAPQATTKLREEILHVVRKIARTVPEFPPYQHLLGHFEWRCGNHALAEAALTRASSFYRTHMEKHKLSIHEHDGWIRSQLYLATAMQSRGRFDEAMTGGRGFIGLAAMIFGRWHPVGALMAALIFGFADSLQQKLAILRTPIPSEFLAMAPYIATIVFVAGLIGTARAPHAIGKPYIKE